MRKAQIQAQVFVYILMIIIVSLILLYGYSAVKDFGKKSQQISLIESKGMIKNAIEKNSAYGIIKKVEINLPDPYTKICFASSELIGELSRIQGGYNEIYQGNSNIEDGFEIIADSIESAYNRNMFYFPDGTESMNVGKIIVDDYFKCFSKMKGVVVLRIEGQGDSARIKAWG